MTISAQFGVDDIQSFTGFLRNAKDYTKRLKKTGRPSILTVNGHAELVVQDARSYQNLLSQLDELADLRAVQAGIADMKAGRGQEMSAVFDRLETQYLSKPTKRGKTK